MESIEQCNQKKLINYPDFLVSNDENLNDIHDMVSGFNEFFVNVGLELADKIKYTDKSKGNTVENIARNPDSIYLKPVDAKEIIVIVKRFNIN